jgi:hypothetical protein
MTMDFWTWLGYSLLGLLVIGAIFVVFYIHLLASID